VLAEPAKGGRPQDSTAPKLARAEIRRAAAEKRIELAPLRRRVIEAEATIARLTKDLAKIDAALAEPGLFARDAVKAATLAKSRSEAATALTQAEEDWLTASAAIEAAMA
jgi:ATP-binding cassette subfamily F protein 3